MYRIHLIRDNVVQSSTSWTDPVLAIRHLKDMLDIEGDEDLAHYGKFPDPSDIKMLNYSWHCHLDWDITWQLVNEGGE